MASRSTRKTWETAFLLSASMSSSYQETFDRAHEILKDLGMDTVNIGDEAERAGQRQENAFNLAAAAVLESGLMDLLGKVKDAYTEIIQVTAEFEYTMSAVEALSDAGAENVALLEEKARTLGETTVFTAQQSAEAMTFMAQAGWDTTEMLEGMDGVISLAAASGTELAEASSIVADTLAGFGMEASETARLSDVLAKTASDTNTNVSMMGQAFSNSAAIAGALGFEIEDVSVMLGLMANAGIKGSKAGTSLRNIFNGLAKDVTLTAEAFGEVDVSMFDENGKPKGLVEVVKELREYFGQMKENEKIANAREIATMRGFNGLLAIINATDEQFDELYANIENADGAAKKMADTRLDNLKGDVTLLNSAFESLKVTIGEELTPAGRGAVQFLTTFVQGAKQFVEMHPDIVFGINSIAGAAGGALATITAGAGALKVLSGFKLIREMFGAGAAAPIVAGLGALAGVFTAVAIKAAAADQAARDMYTDQIRMAEDIQTKADAYRENEKVWKEAIGAIEDEAGNTEYLIGRLESLQSAQDKTLGQKQEILAIVDILNEKIPELALAYDAEADSINLTADAIRERARAEADAELMAERNAKLTEKIKQENALNADVENAAEAYKNAKAEYDRIYSEEMESQSKWMGRKNAEKSMAYNRNVLAAKEAKEAAHNALIKARNAQQDNAWWIDELSRQLSGEERESGRSTGGGGTPDQHTALAEKNAAEEYAENLAELNSRLIQRTTLAQNLASAEKRYEEAGAWWNYYREEDADARAAYDLYRAERKSVNPQMENEAQFRADRMTTISRDIYEAYADIQAAEAAIAENEEEIEALSASVAGYEGAEAAKIAAEGYTVNVENTINITGSVDDDTLEELQENIEEAVDRALENRKGTRNRLAYDGGD